MAFRCKHCGQCCIDECTQINLSIGDIVRILNFTRLTVAEILQKIGIKPFGDPEKPNHFEYELGLNIPCEFRQDGKCSIYPARPLNCRMFPYMFLGNLESKDLRQAIDPSHKCVTEGISISEAEKKKYHEYSRFIGEMILEEARLTDEFYDKNKLRQSNIVPEYLFPAEDPNDPVHAKEITRSKIRLAMSMMKKQPYADLKNQLQNFIMGVEDNVASFEGLNEKEKNLLGKGSNSDAKMRKI